VGEDEVEDGLTITNIFNIFWIAIGSAKDAIFGDVLFDVDVPLMLLRYWLGQEVQIVWCSTAVWLKKYS
jgi:hypothetical protein